MRKTRHRGTRRVDWMFTFALAAYNLVRIRTLTTQSAFPTGHRFRASRTVSPRPAIRGAGRLLCVLPLAQWAAGAPRGEQKCCRHPLFPQPASTTVSLTLGDSWDTLAASTYAQPRDRPRPAVSRVC